MYQIKVEVTDKNLNIGNLGCLHVSIEIQISKRHELHTVYSRFEHHECGRGCG